MTEALPADSRDDAGPASSRSTSPAYRRPLLRFIWPRLAWPWEVLTVLIGDAAYEVIRSLAPQHESQAFHNARMITRLEPTQVKALETWSQGWVNSHHVAQLLFGGYYALLHLTVTVAVLVWLWWRRPEYYPRARTVLFVLTFGALVLFWIFPVAPPRLAVPGAVDTVGSLLVGSAGAAVTGVGSANGAATGLVNPYAAFPSLHVAWAAWCAWAVWWAWGNRLLRLPGGERLRWAAWLYPLATTIVVVGTANHYLVDVAAGIGALALTIVGSSAASRTVFAPGQMAVSGAVPE